MEDLNTSPDKKSPPDYGARTFQEMSSATPALVDPRGPGGDPGPAETDDNPLEEQLTNEKLKRLEKIFEDADEDGGGGLDMEEFRHAMRQTMGSHVTDEELDMIFMKVDTNCDGTVDWDEYLTYMLLECREKDSMSIQARQPFPRDVRLYKGEHRDSIVRVLFVPHIIQTNSTNILEFQVDLSHGKYLAASKEGVVTTLGMQDFEQPATHRIQPTTPHTSLWITDVAFLPRSHTLASGTTNREILFYEMVNDKFKLISRITALKGCPVSLTFWSHTKKASRGFLLWGDDRGGISAVVFSRALSMSPLHPKFKSGRTRYAFAEILGEKVEHLKGYYLPNIHNDMVRQVMYCDQHASFLSCSRDSHTAMFLGDLEQKLTKSYFKVMKGINSFDYCDKLNIIASGGYDGIVRVWNPYVPLKPILLLRGHKSPILHVHINPVKDHIISIAENKEVRIHDLNTQTCIQTFYRKMLMEFGPRAMLASLFNTQRQALLLATTLVGILEQREGELKHQSMQSHKKSVTAVLYNPLFKQVVSADIRSQVCVWSIMTGEKVMQFIAHTTRASGRFVSVEVTAMTFDPTFRRLITAGSDGTVKIWNFNNGAMLRQLPQATNCDVTSLVCPPQRIVTAGWNRNVLVFIDDADDDSYSKLNPATGDDITSMAVHPPNVIAAGCQDGEIMIWSLDTMRPILNFNTTTKQSMGPVHIQNLLHGHSRRSEDADEDRPESLERKGVRRQRVQFSGDSLLPLEDDGRYLPRYFKAQGVSKLLFLHAREQDKNTGNLVAACQDGFIQFWSMSHDEGMIGEFFAAHDRGEYVVCMVASQNNEFLVTGDSRGYIRVWDITHFCVVGKKCDPETDATRKDIWGMFPYMSMRTSVLQSTRRHTMRHIGGENLLLKGTGTAHLINSMRGHLQPVTAIDLAVIGSKTLIITSSTDCSVRLWSLQGEFLGIFGQPAMWSNVKSVLALDRKPPSQRTVLLPPDVRRVASAITLRVLNAGPNKPWLKARNILRWIAKFAVGRETGDHEEVEKEPQEEEVDAEEATPEKKSQWDQSKILGKTYKRSARYHPLPTLPKPVCSFSTQCVAFRSLPIHEDLDDTGSLSNIRANEQLSNIQSRYQLPALGSRPDKKMTIAKVIAISQMTRLKNWKSNARREKAAPKKKSGWQKLSERRTPVSLLPKECKSPEESVRRKSEDKSDKKCMLSANEGK